MSCGWHNLIGWGGVGRRQPQVSIRISPFQLLGLSLCEAFYFDTPSQPQWTKLWNNELKSIFTSLNCLFQVFWSQQQKANKTLFKYFQITLNQTFLRDRGCLSLFWNRGSLCMPETCYIDQVGVELAMILLLLPPKCGDYKRVPPHPYQKGGGCSLVLLCMCVSSNVHAQGCERLCTSMYVGISGWHQAPSSTALHLRHQGSGFSPEPSAQRASLSSWLLPGTPCLNLQSPSITVGYHICPTFVWMLGIQTLVLTLIKHFIYWAHEDDLYTEEY